jgi:hypothetical protein
MIDISTKKLEKSYLIIRDLSHLSSEDVGKDGLDEYMWFILMQEPQGPSSSI